MHQDERFADDGDKAQQRSFSLKNGDPDTRNEGTVTGHFQHIIKGQDTRAARGEILLPAGDNPRRDRVQRGEASRTENLNHSTARSRAAAANGEPVVVDAAQCSAADMSRPAQLRHGALL